MTRPSQPDLASFLRRLSAALLDSFVFFLPLALLVPAPLSSHRRYFLLAFALVSLCMMVWWALMILRGQTPGKFLLGIRAVREDGSPLGPVMSFVREMLVKRLLGIMFSVMTGGLFFLLDYLWCLWDRRHQTLHDKICGSLVVRWVRPPRPAPSEPEPVSPEVLT